MRQLIISNSIYYEKIAILDNGRLEEFFFEEKKNKSLLSNIYKGRVVDILPGMQAAFVDIGLEKNAYLYIDSLLSTKTLKEKNLKKSSVKSISDVLKKGEEILVQINREPIGEKNISVTTDISLAGKCIALIPKNKEVNASKKIKSLAERKRLIDIGKEIIEDDYGMIIRTFAENKDKEFIENDYKELLAKYKKIEQEFNYSYAPKLMMENISFTEKIFLEYFDETIKEIYVEDDETKRNIEAILKKCESYCNLSDVKIIDTCIDTFESFKLEKQFLELLDRKVMLKSGGSIVIDTAEAFTIIDVNSGKFIGKSNQDETALEINIEALYEIARQVRLRNISGIIIIDFIDFRKKDYTDVLLKKSKEVFALDKAKTKVLGMTKLNLMEMTRKKDSDNFYNAMYDSCLCCHGTGRTISSRQIVFMLENIANKIVKNTSCEVVVLKCNPFIFNKINNELSDFVQELESSTKLDIRFIEDRNMDNNTIEIEKMGKKSAF